MRLHPFLVALSVTVLPSSVVSEVDKKTAGLAHNSGLAYLHKSGLSVGKGFDFQSSVDKYISSMIKSIGENLRQDVKGVEDFARELLQAAGDSNDLDTMIESIGQDAIKKTGQKGVVYSYLNLWEDVREGVSSKEFENAYDSASSSAKGSPAVAVGESIRVSTEGYWAAYGGGRRELKETCWVCVGADIVSGTIFTVVAGATTTPLGAAALGTAIGAASSWVSWVAGEVEDNLSE